MSNMTHCRFHNTLQDLKDCYANMDEADISPEEERERTRLIRLCVLIAGDYGDEVDCLDLPTTFNPNWKTGARLTTLGRQTLETAFKRGMRQSEAARLFRISLTRAHVLHREWRGLANGHGGSTAHETPTLSSATAGGARD